MCRPTQGAGVSQGAGLTVQARAKAIYTDSARVLFFFWVGNFKLNSRQD